MKQDKRPAGAAVKKRRFFNRISRKLMLFVVLMSMVLLALVWLLSVKLLEPMYNRRVLADLNHAADVYSAIIEKYGKFPGRSLLESNDEECLQSQCLLCAKRKIPVEHHLPKRYNRCISTLHSRRKDCQNTPVACHEPRPP